MFFKSQNTDKKNCILMLILVTVSRLHLKMQADKTIRAKKQVGFFLRKI